MPNQWDQSLSSRAIHSFLKKCLHPKKPVMERGEGEPPSKSNVCFHQLELFFPVQIFPLI
jgi:hypothetical protein